MNAEELRRLSEEAAERKKHEAQDAQRKAAEEKQKHQEEYNKRCWEHARNTVAELEAKVRNAASKGEREVLLYTLHSSQAIPVEVRCVRRIFSQPSDHCKVTHTGFPTTRSMSMTTALT